MMLKVITANSFGWQVSGSQSKIQRKALKRPKILSMGKTIHSSSKSLPRAEEKSVDGVKKIGIILILAVMLAGAFYLYQVNNLATKGYEIKEVESQIQKLQTDSQKLKIRETELRSMYNLEKETQNLDLVNPTSVSYLELNGPVAMKQDKQDVSNN